MGKYAEKDAAKDTGASVKEVNKAWHDARDAAAKEGGMESPKNATAKTEDRIHQVPRMVINTRQGTSIELGNPKLVA